MSLSPAERVPKIDESAEIRQGQVDPAAAYWKERWILSV